LVSHTVVDNPIEKESEQKEMKELVDKGLSKIEPKYREILVLYYIEGLSYKEIADILHIPVSTVGVRIMRAKEILKTTYKEMKIEI
jgi:RNA polymerase sigma-70 factor (ECF subfamily)